MRTVAARHGLSAGAVHRHLTQHVDQPTVGEILPPDWLNRSWTRWDGTEWVPIEEPDPADLIDLHRPRNAKYRVGLRSLGGTAVIEVIRPVYRLRKYPRRDVGEVPDSYRKYQALVSRRN